MMTSYIKAILLEWKQIMNMHIWLLETFTGGKMKISSHLINFQETINIAPFTVLIFNPLKKTFSFALENHIGSYNWNQN